MKTAHISGRSIQLVSGFKNLPELSEKLKPIFIQSIERRLPRPTTKEFYQTSHYINTCTKEDIRANEESSYGCIKR